MLYEYTIVEQLVNINSPPKNKIDTTTTRNEIGRNEFINQVNAHCLDGWEPIGNVSYVDRALLNTPGSGPFIYLQAMKRPKIKVIQ